MSHEAVQTLVERYLNDEGFRAAMRTDPVAALAATGLELSAEEQAGLLKNDWSLSDEELGERISKVTAVSSGGTPCDPPCSL